MQRICRLICKICRICKQICNKICTKYDIRYAINMQNMQKNMQNMSYQKTFQVYPKICKICNEYAKYVSQNLICRICTPHFADGWHGVSVHHVASHRDSSSLGISKLLLLLPRCVPACQWRVHMSFSVCVCLRRRACECVCAAGATRTGAGR
jgi:hypothetical protein